MLSRGNNAGAHFVQLGQYGLDVLRAPERVAAVNGGSFQHLPVERHQLPVASRFRGGRDEMRERLEILHVAHARRGLILWLRGGRRGVSAWIGMLTAPRSETPGHSGRSWRGKGEGEGGDVGDLTRVCSC